MCVYVCVRACVRACVRVCSSLWPLVGNALYKCSQFTILRMCSSLMKDENVSLVIVLHLHNCIHPKETEAKTRISFLENMSHIFKQLMDRLCTLCFDVRLTFNYVSLSSLLIMVNGLHLYST